MFFPFHRLVCVESATEDEPLRCSWSPKIDSGCSLFSLAEYVEAEYQKQPEKGQGRSEDRTQV